MESEPESRKEDSIPVVVESSSSNEEKPKEDEKPIESPTTLESTPPTTPALVEKPNEQKPSTELRDEPIKDDSVKVKRAPRLAEREGNESFLMKSQRKFVEAYENVADEDYEKHNSNPCFLVFSSCIFSILALGYAIVGWVLYKFEGQSLTICSHPFEITLIGIPVTLVLVTIAFIVSSARTHYHLHNSFRITFCEKAENKSIHLLTLYYTITVIGVLALNILNCIWSYTEEDDAGCKQLYSFRYLFVTSVLFYIACCMMPFVACCSYIQYRLGNIKKAKKRASRIQSHNTGKMEA